MPESDTSHRGPIAALVIETHSSYLCANHFVWFWGSCFFPLPTHFMRRTRMTLCTRSTSGPARHAVCHMTQLSRDTSRHMTPRMLIPNERPLEITWLLALHVRHLLREARVGRFRQEAGEGRMQQLAGVIRSPPSILDLVTRRARDIDSLRGQLAIMWPGVATIDHQASVIQGHQYGRLHYGWGRGSWTNWSIPRLEQL